MKCLFIFLFLLPQLALAEAPLMENGRFPEKEYGSYTILKLTEKQLLTISTPKKNKGSFLTKLPLTQKQQQQIFKEAQLKITFIEVFDGQKGYQDCGCFGLPSNLAAKFNQAQVQIPHCFIRDPFMEKEDAETRQRWLTLDIDKSPPNKSHRYVLKGKIGNFPATFELDIHADKNGSITGTYTYQAGKHKGKPFKILGKKIRRGTFHLREYKLTKTTPQHSADIHLVRTNKLFSKRDPWSGTMTNIDGTQYAVRLQTTQRIKSTGH